MMNPPVHSLTAFQLCPPRKMHRGPDIAMITIFHNSTPCFTWPSYVKSSIRIVSSSRANTFPPMSCQMFTKEPIFLLPRIISRSRSIKSYTFNDYNNLIKCKRHECKKIQVRGIVSYWTRRGKWENAMSWFHSLTTWQNYNSERFFCQIPDLTWQLSTALNSNFQISRETSPPQHCIALHSKVIRTRQD